MKVLITGASGFLGSRLVYSILQNQPGWDILACDILEPKNIQPTDDPRKKLKKYNFINLSVTDRVRLFNEIRLFKPDSIVHLATTSNLTGTTTMEVQREIDIEGIRNVIDGGILVKSSNIVFISSDSVYGFHKDNSECLVETDPLRDSNADYSNKKKIEELLANYRETHPKMGQLILRSSAILGENDNNLLTNYIQKKIILGVMDCSTPFVFTWFEDIINIIVYGLRKKKYGIFNVGGDGFVSLEAIAKILNKPLTFYPAWVYKGLYGLMSPMGLSQFNQDNIDSLMYRSPISNQSLKKDFGYIPKFTSFQALYKFLQWKKVAYSKLDLH